MQKRLFLLVLTALGLGSAPALAADADNGQRLAERWCASCHVISTSQRQATDGVAPFSAIAKMPQFNAQKLAYFLLEPHPKMPDMSLSRRDAEDLAAFIEKSGP
jgi:mono/diheme cytochrome c family protein